MLGFRVAMYKSMDDDFNTAGAIAALHDLAGIINRHIDTHRLEADARQTDKLILAAAGRWLVSCGQILGLFEPRRAPTGRAAWMASSWTC